MSAGSVTPPALLDVATDPFPHFVAHPVLAPDVADALLDWLRTDAPWRLHETALFSQYECDVGSAELPGGCSVVRSDAFRASVRATFAEAWQESLDGDVEIHAHRLGEGQGIGLHTDIPQAGAETYRLVLTLGHGYRDERGGHLLLFGGDDKDDVRRVFRPLHNVAVGLALSTTSYHAVGIVHEGERYSVIFSCREASLRA